MLKTLSGTIVEEIKQIMNAILKEEKIPKEWQTGIIMPMFRKGDNKTWGNYRLMTLLGAIVKTHPRIPE